MRPSERTPNQIRPVTFTRQYTMHAEGSVLVEFGNTKVLCTASVEAGVPRFMKGQGKGWVTAEYGMLPRSTHTRNNREAARGKQGGRTMEIQRLIARALRAAVDLKALGENTITIDCDVIQADGGTRTASISGACVALVDALTYMRSKGMINTNPLKHMIAAISVGIGVDNTIHYMERFRREFSRFGNYRDTMFFCHNSIGRAMYFTSMTIVAGFSILSLSNFIPTIVFGLLTSFAMLVALVGSLTLLPQLLVTFKPLGPESR